MWGLWKINLICSVLDYPCNGRKPWSGCYHTTKGSTEWGIFVFWENIVNKCETLTQTFWMHSLNALFSNSLNEDSDTWLLLWTSCLKGNSLTRLESLYLGCFDPDLQYYFFPLFPHSNNSTFTPTSRHDWSAVRKWDESQGLNLSSTVFLSIFIWTTECNIIATSCLLLFTMMANFPVRPMGTTHRTSKFSSSKTKPLKLFYDFFI